MNETDIKSMNLTELTAFVEGLSEKKFRAKQLYEWMHVKCVKSFDEMTNLSVKFRETLKENCFYCVLKPVEILSSKTDGTKKYLFELPDGNIIESVLMRYKFGNSVCISSQVGCRMGCKFCASTIDGVVRGLTPAEMLEQIYRISEDVGERVSHVVIMGSGEPLDNFDNFIKFLDMVSNSDGINLGQRNITVSTCGIVPRIKELADMKPQINLALSLHASNQEKRKALMPVANKYPLDEVLDACRYYFDRTKRRITFEYSLVAGVNDTDEDARELGELVSKMNCHINLIPVNPIKESEYKSPDNSAVLSFKNKLEKNGINVTIRREMGRDINGACGQLRRRYLKGVNS